MIMSCFGKIGNSISSKSKELSQKAKAFSETSSLKNILKAEQSKLDTNYKMIGKLYFEKYGECPAEEFAESVDAVKESLNKISETQEQIERIRNRNCCPNCGAQFKIDAVFCSKCGTKVREEEQKTKKITCANCGNKLEEGALFCDSCGTKTDSKIPLSETSENPAEPEPTEQEVPQPEEIICANCGNKLDEGALFCDNCGAKANSEIQLPDIPEKSAEPESTENEIPQPEEKPLETQTEYTIVLEKKNDEETSDENKQTDSVKKCPSCGKELNDEQAVFCNSCGTKL